MTRALLAGAVLATLADAVAFVGLIVPGHVAEQNPLFAGGPAVLPLAAKACLVVVLLALAAVLEDRRRELRAVLLVAIATGLVGAGSTIGALS